MHIVVTPDLQSDKTVLVQKLQLHMLQQSWYRQTPSPGHSRADDWFQSQLHLEILKIITAFYCMFVLKQYCCIQMKYKKRN